MNLLLRFTTTNTLDLENRLFELYSEIHALVDSFLPEEEDDDMPPLEDIPDDFKACELLCITHVTLTYGYILYMYS